MPPSGQSCAACAACCLLMTKQGLQLCYRELLLGNHYSSRSWSPSSRSCRQGRSWSPSSRSCRQGRSCQSQQQELQARQELEFQQHELQSQQQELQERQELQSQQQELQARQELQSQQQELQARQELESQQEQQLSGCEQTAASAADLLCADQSSQLTLEATGPNAQPMARRGSQTGQDRGRCRPRQHQRSYGC